MQSRFNLVSLYPITCPLPTLLSTVSEPISSTTLYKGLGRLFLKFDILVYFHHSTTIQHIFSLTFLFLALTFNEPYNQTLQPNPTTNSSTNPSTHPIMFVFWFFSLRFHNAHGYMFKRFLADRQPKVSTVPLNLVPIWYTLPTVTR